jgi:hypothetical protein
MVRLCPPRVPDLLVRACPVALLLLSACAPREEPPASTEPPAPTDIERYDCYAIGRLQGVMVQQSELGAVHPVFAQPIRSRWVFAWSAQWTSEVVPENDGDGGFRTFEHARDVELMLPVDLGHPEQALDSTLSATVVAQAAQLD